MTGCAIVAIPEANDHVWKISSEKIPHMTLLFLGELNAEETFHIAQFVSHAAKMFRRFGADSNFQGPLGPDKADVMFFNAKRLKDVADFRSTLLQDPIIFKAYNRIEQYPEWTPHLTLGYPETPAKKDNREYPSTYVFFDRIALWTGDYEGPEVYMRDYEMAEMEVAMSDSGDKFLAHFGVPGMKWGRRKSSTSSIEDGAVVLKQNNLTKKITATGGRNTPVHEDAIKSAISKQKAKVSSTDSLSTKDLQEMVNRMNLEQQYAKLSAGQKSPGQKFVAEFVGKVAKEQLTKYATQQVTGYLSKSATGGASPRRAK